MKILLSNNYQERKYGCLFVFSNGPTQILLHRLIAHDIKYRTANKDFGWLWAIVNQNPWLWAIVNQNPYSQYDIWYHGLWACEEEFEFDHSQNQSNTHIPSSWLLFNNFCIHGTWQHDFVVIKCRLKENSPTSFMGTLHATMCIPCISCPTTE